MEQNIVYYSYEMLSSEGIRGLMCQDLPQNNRSTFCHGVTMTEQELTVWCRIISHTNIHSFSIVQRMAPVQQSLHHIINAAAITWNWAFTITQIICRVILIRIQVTRHGIVISYLKGVH